MWGTYILGGQSNFWRGSIDYGCNEGLVFFPPHRITYLLLAFLAFLKTEISDQVQKKIIIKGREKKACLTGKAEH